MSCIEGINFEIIKNNNDLIQLSSELKDNGISTISLCYKNDQLRVYPGFHDNHFYDEFDAYMKLLIMNHSLLKNDLSYGAHEESYIDFCKEHNTKCNFKGIFLDAFSDWISCLYEEFGQDESRTLELFEQIIKMSNKEIQEGFKIASIDFIKTNKSGVGYARKLIENSEVILKSLEVESSVLQLLQPSLDNFYKKFGYEKLETVKDNNLNLEFMEKKLL